MSDSRLMGPYTMELLRRDFDRAGRAATPFGSYNYREAMRQLFDHCDALAERVEELEGLLRAAEHEGLEATGLAMLQPTHSPPIA
jgi:hypothetical protein